jgi:SAM-dependent methyltransferase
MDARIWNASAGKGWVAADAALDQMFAPFNDLLTAGAPAGRVLDVGCGTGGTTAALARQGADCVGIDPSAPMLAAARARMVREAAAAAFIQADAQTYVFAPGEFDAVISRFGVMFFADPVAAFANLRQATRSGGHPRFAAWRGAEENPFLTTAEHAATPLLPDIAVPGPGAPGPFAFARRDWIFSVLRDSGWAAIEIEPIDVACRFAEAELDNYLAVMGPVGRALQQVDDGTRARAMARIRPAFDHCVRDTEVQFTAACWMVDARVPSVLTIGAADA